MGQSHLTTSGVWSSEATEVAIKNFHCVDKSHSVSRSSLLLAPRNSDHITQSHIRRGFEGIKNPETKWKQVKIFILNIKVSSKTNVFKSIAFSKSVGEGPQHFCILEMKNTRTSLGNTIFFIFLLLLEI